ncbi:MAG: hypothetical protein MSH18_02165 [Bacteroidales bacterium]|nr:hypothetical protein [Bacteroidales bacterium]
MLGLLFVSAVSTKAQITDGDPISIAINKTTGTKYRNGAIDQNSNYVGRWVSTAVPGLSFEYNNGSGLANNLTITEANVNCAWMNGTNQSHQYIFRLTGESAVRYKLLGYDAHSTRGKLITTDAPTAVDHTFSATSSDVSVNYTSEVGVMKFRNGINNPGDMWVDGRITVRLQPMKVRKVVYVIKEAGQVVHTTDSILVRIGAATIPASVTRPATQLTLETQNVEETTTQVVVNAVFAAPFDKVSQEAGHKYFLHDNNPNKHYLNFTAGQTAILTTTAKQYNNSYYWTFKGNPYTGVSIKNVGNNGFLNKSGSNVIADATITEDQAKWNVNFNNVTFSSSYTLPTNTTGFTLKYPSHNDPLNVNGNTLNLSFWSTADNNSLFLVERAPDTRIAYVVKNEGTEVFRDSVYVNYGPATIPTALQRPLTQLTLAQEGQVINESTQEVVVNAVFSAPFDKASQDAGKKFIIRDKNNHYLSHQEGTAYTLTQVRNFPTAYQWLIKGNPYVGVTIQSAANNGYLKKNANDNFVIARTDVSATDAKWEVNFNNVRPHNNYDLTTPPGGFTLKDVVKGQALNVNGSNFKLSFWEYVDGNSLFYAELVPEDLKEMVIADFQAVDVAGSNNPFTLNEAAYSRFKNLYDAAVSKAGYVTPEEYSAIRLIVDSVTNYVLPESGYYRIKNANVTDRYMNLEGTMLRVNKNRAEAQKDATTIIYVDKQADGTYLLKTSGRTLSVSNTNNGENKTVEASTATAIIQNVNMSLAGVGKGYLQFGTANLAYLFYWSAESHRVHTYSKDYDGTGQWSLERAKTVTVPLNSHEGKSYATACFPFPVSISTENVKAYNVVPQGATGRSNMEELATEIPVGTPMLLVSETAADSVTFTIGESAPTSTEPTTAAFKGNFLGRPVTANTLLTLGRSSSTPQKVGFYKYTGTTLAPFRAYFTAADLTALLAGANGFSLNFDDLTTGVSGVEVQTESTGSVYDLAGRKVTKATKGLYIINGKKVIR